MDAALQFNDPLDQDDPRYVPSFEARGENAARTLYRALGVDDRGEAMVLRTRHPRFYGVLCGHRGCGKSTELRRIADHLHHPNVFFVIFLDALDMLDYITYAEVLLALARQLFECLEREAIPVDDIILQNLKDWFAPDKNNSASKEDRRRLMENRFSQFAQSFNRCIAAAEDAVIRADKGRKILFIIDGTDRLSRADSQRFFLDEIDLLKQIQSLFIYCADIALLYEGNPVQMAFYPALLPLIQLKRKESNAPLPKGYDTMRQMVYHRAAPRLFESPELVEKLVGYSGGNPRELLKLMHYSFLRANRDVLDDLSVEAAIADLARDYKRILDSEDYLLLCRLEAGENAGEDRDRIHWLIAQLAVLEYADGWREVHPVIKTLSGYQAAKMDSDSRKAKEPEPSDATVFLGKFAPPVQFAEIENLTAFPRSPLRFGPHLNLFIGENATGKTHLLKAIYAILAALTSARRQGPGDKTAWENAIAAKLNGVFRPEVLGRLVRHGCSVCRIGLGMEGKRARLDLRFAADTAGDIAIQTLPEFWPDTPPVFFPSRELLGIFPNFVSVYDNRYLEFEETWRDVCVLLGGPPLREPPPKTRELLSHLESFMGGTLELDRNGRFYLFTPEAGKMEIPLVAEGLRKFAMLARLLITGALNSRGYLFWDEPESGMNPRLLAHLAKSILTLASHGVQVFIATHSLFFLREVEILLSHSPFNSLAPRFFGLHEKDKGVRVQQGDSIDDVGDIAALDEQLAQSDRFMALEEV